MNVLILGDIVGKPGRQICTALLPKIRERENIDFVIANGENLAGGSSVTEETVDEIFRAGVDVITTGDHIFRKREGAEVVEKNRRVIRPLNYPPGTPGKGSVITSSQDGVSVGVINLLGRVFMKPVDCPFRTVEKELEAMLRQTPVVFVDVHAEATSEKIAMGWFLDGRATAVFGTHTHIQTSDEIILTHGTAYITELGMCGPYRSVIGRRTEQVLKQFISQIPARLEVADGDIRISGIVVEVNPANGRALSIRRVQEKLGE